MKRLTVLLIEDDLLDAKMICDMLRRFDRSAFEMIHVTTLGAATNHLVHGKIDAVLLDLSLPDAAGLEALDPIRASIPDTPILVLTGNDDQDLALAAVKSRAQDYLVKWTFNEQLLARAIRHAVERQRIQSELAAAKETAEIANRSKSEFLANISHELRTPLTAVLGMAELLSETALGAEQSRYLHTLQKAGTHLVGLIDEVLDLGRIESGHLTVESAPFELRKTLQGAVDFLTIRARNKQLDLRLSVGADVPAWVRGDARRLRQVLVNLIGNAIKFTESGFIAVEVGLERELGVLRFSVRDTGVGIPPGKLETIFDRFAQADASISRTRGGSGLGLAIARPLVELMGGRLNVTSTLGEGSTFSFSLPAEATIPVEPSGPHRIIDGTQRPLRILIADDAEDNRWLFESYLKKTNHEIDLATDGAEAISLFEKRPTDAPYDLVLLDMHMPIVDGPTAAREIRELEKRRGLQAIPIVAITADALTASLDKFLESGCSGYLTKPFSKEDLLQTIAQYAPRAAATPPAEKPDGNGHGEKVQSDGRVSVHVDRELYPMMPRFLANRRADVDKIKNALAAGDYDLVWTIGHNMKGSSAGYQTPSLGELGGQLATAAKQKDVALITKLARDLQFHLDRIDVVCTGESRPNRPTLKIVGEY